MTFRRLLLALLGVTTLTVPSLAQLTNTTTTAKACLVGSTYWGQITNYNNWTYTDAYGAHLFSGTSWQISGSAANCPAQSTGGFTGLSVDGLGYKLTANGSVGTVTLPTINSGFVNPKYVIVGVTYAPPGPSSFVNYSKSTLVGTQTMISNSFLKGVSVTIKVGAGIKGWGADGNVTGTSSTSYTQTSGDSSTVIMSKQSTIGVQTPGPSNPYVGINHDYDVVWLWLNPLALFSTFKTSTTNGIQWKGYGYSTVDQPAMDIYPVYIGWLNGDIPMTPSQAAPLARTWAATEVWPTGQGPGITSADFKLIEQSDPYWQCTPTPSACPTTIDPVRYTLTTANQDFFYQQAPAGGQPQPQTYSDVYTNTTTQNQSAQHEFSQMFGMEEVFNVSAFFAQLKVDLSQSTTLTWTHKWEKQMTTTNTSSASLSITGPPCVIPGNPCHPNYTKSTQFDLYQDVLYGTFLLNPVN
jgi:hypothetical protein